MFALTTEDVTITCMGPQDVIAEIATSLDSSIRQPLYEQLTAALREAVETGGLPPGTALPPEKELAAQLGVSRQTVNVALTKLSKRGLIYRRRGTGTFVAEPFVEQPLGGLSGGKISSVSETYRPNRSRGQPLVLMMQATEYGMGDDPARSRRACPGGRPRRGVEAQGAMRSPAVVIRAVLAQHGEQMPLIDDDEVIQTLSPQRADHAFGDGVGLGSVNWCEQGLNAHQRRLGIEAAAIAAVAITDHVLRLLAPWCGFSQLLPNPLCCRVGGHVQVNEPAPAMRDEDDDVERLHGDGLNREEVGRPDVGCVVPEESSPGLRRWAAVDRSAVAPDGPGAYLIAQLAQFADDAHAAPERVRCQRITVSGCTKRTADRQPDHIVDSPDQKSRSVAVSLGRDDFRESTATC